MRTREDTPLEDPTGPVIGCLHHLAPPMPGAAAAALHGARLDHRHLRDGDPLPDLGEVDGIVSFGGDQSVLELERYPYLVDEVALLRAAVERDVPVLGICLGAQLLAHALGGSVRRLPSRAVTWARLAHTPAAARDPLVSALPDPVPALHWNEDAIEPPPGAEELLDRGGLGCAAFRLGSACGVQFHADVDGATLDRWYAAYGDWLAAAGVDEEDARAMDARYLPGQAAVADALFGGFAELTRARAVPGRAVR